MTAHLEMDWAVCSASCRIPPATLLRSCSLPRNWLTLLSLAVGSLEGADWGPACCPAPAMSAADSNVFSIGFCCSTKRVQMLTQAALMQHRGDGLIAALQERLATAGCLCSNVSLSYRPCCILLQLQCGRV